MLFPCGTLTCGTFFAPRFPYNSNIARPAWNPASVRGMPTLTNLSDLAKEAEDWLVEWRLVEGSPPHAYYSLAPNEAYGTIEEDEIFRESREQ